MSIAIVAIVTDPATLLHSTMQELAAFRDMTLDQLGSMRLLKQAGRHHLDFCHEVGRRLAPPADQAWSGSQSLKAGEFLEVLRKAAETVNAANEAQVTDHDIYAICHSIIAHSLMEVVGGAAGWFARYPFPAS